MKRLLIGIICEQPHPQRSSEVINGIASQAFKCNCDVVVLTPLCDMMHLISSHLELKKNIYKLVLSEKFDGFLYDRRFIFNKDILAYIDNLLKKTGKPVMMIDGCEHPLFENTSAEDSKPYEKLVNHFIEVHGYTKIFCLTGPEDSSPARERLNGFFNAMERHELPFNKSSYRYGDFWTQSAKQLAEDIIEKKIPMPEAVVCGNDITATVLIDCLTKGGIKVPDDISVAGFDFCINDDLINPNITSYRRANFQLGAESFRHLYRIITGNICPKIKNQKDGLRIGCSCGCQRIPLLTGKEIRENKIKTFNDRKMIFNELNVIFSNTINIHDCLKLIGDNTFWIYKFTDFRVCLTKNFFDYINGNFENSLRLLNGQKMVQVLERKSSGYSMYNNIDFCSDNILPDLKDSKIKPSLYYISPLHNNDSFFGYAALSFGKNIECFSKGYLVFTSCISNALEYYRQKSLNEFQIKKNSFSSTEDLPVIKQFDNSILKQFSENKTLFFIYIEITDIKKIFLKSDHNSFSDILRFFSDKIKSCIKEKEFLGIIFTGCFCIISDSDLRASEIFYELRNKVCVGRIKEKNSNELSFTLGISEIRESRKADFYDVLRFAATNTLFTYNEKKCVNNLSSFEQLCLVREKIDLNPELPWHIDEICSELHMSSSYFQKKYKEFFNNSLYEEIIQFRIKKAESLLLETEISITQISEKCGYSSYCYFTKQFKKITGYSPSEYRKNRGCKK